ncbi:putative ribonuclease H-like domain-containing protein [Tanacetum coccineum]
MCGRTQKLSEFRQDKDTRIFSGAYDDEVEGAKADFNNLESTTIVSHVPITRIHKDHPKEQITGDPLTAPQTRRMIKTSQEHAMHAIGRKWVYRNKKDDRGIVIRNKARLVAQGYTQEEEIDYDEVFAPVARIKVIRSYREMIESSSAKTNSNYARASLDRKPITRGCQFLGKKLISWQCVMDPKLDV